ncbi:MAG: DNA polymerase I [Neisseria sp.]|nr:DNA polymerase I [Neisseria sp.]
MQNTLLLVDGSSYLYRAFHALAPLTSPQGEPTGALFGVLNMLRRLRTEVAHEYCAVVFDAKGKNFRHALYPEYKANRPPMPEDLRPQTEWVRELTALFGWSVLVMDDVEADDVMATLARQGEAAGMKVIMSSGDKDMAQLVNAHITMVDTMKNAVYDEAGVLEKFGVMPRQIVDYLSLIGDTADNVPGVDKCGPKTAVKWLTQYDTLDNIMAHAAEIGGKVGENLQAALARLPLSKQLITLKEDVDLSQALPNGLADLRHREPDWAALAPRLRHFGLRSLLKEAESHLTDNQASLITQTAFRQPETLTPALPEAPPLHYRLVTTQAELDALCARLQAAPSVGFDTETTSLDVRAARLIGMSFAFAPGDAAYVPLAHSITAAPQQLDFDTTLGCLKPFLENPERYKIGQNLKYDRHVLRNHAIELRGIRGDAMLASYIVESHLGHGLDELAQRHLGLTTIKYEDLCGKGAKQISFADVALEDARDYACQDADFALRLEAQLTARMDAAQLTMYRELELPVAEVLYRMERDGVLIDADELHRQSHELGAAMMQLEKDAYAAAGQPFNLNSPKQLQEILFDKLGIPTRGVRKTAGGSYSTDESVLEKLALDYPLPKIILENRTLSKLKSTYTDKLPTLIDATDGRVHTTYAQAVAITGRLASNNPNLQNIPIRSEEGRRVRRAFIAPKDYCIVSADYSQIELRIMAHLSDDATLIAAFAAGEDIHRRTAAEVFNSDPAAVTAEQRRYAKTINFGLIYGMGQYGLAKSLDIDNDAAKNFIERYFARYPAVAEYMERTKRQAREQGYVETLFGRKLYLPDIASSNGNRRAAAERAAINAPMQGTASDLIKRAMLEVAAWLKRDRLRSRLIMQVHDELVLEVAADERETVKHRLPEIMQNAGKLKVPLLAEVGVGQNWEEAH